MDESRKLPMMPATRQVRDIRWCRPNTSSWRRSPSSWMPPTNLSTARCWTFSLQTHGFSLPHIKRFWTLLL